MSFSLLIRVCNATGKQKEEELVVDADFEGCRTGTATVMSGNHKIIFWVN
jgi:hypothetical protein